MMKSYDAHREEPLQEVQQQWKTISLTHVEYVKGDVVGYLLAWFSLLPVFIVVGFITLIIFKRDLHTMCYFIGLTVNECLNWLIKNIIKEPRPSKGHDILFTEYGMPSNHAQFIWFFVTYLILFLFIRVHQNVYSIDNLWKFITSLGSVVVGFLVSVSRVYLEYHHLSQVVCGALIGSVIGAIWFFIVHRIFTPYFPLVAAWPVSEFLMLRDSTLIPNVLWFEYTSHRTEARSRLRKMSCRKSS